ncbi:thiol:disulfide interchange protein TlpA [Xanthobacter sp. AM11]|uniref:thiol:disulfide interchange protein TlpA n=1 Tax=Xanthobacter sp. AM11 TaxID=3380643 RepID=UPI0039BEFE3B
MTDADPPHATDEPETRPGTPAGGRRWRFGTIGLITLATLAGAVAGALALYGMNRLPGNAPAAQTSAGAAPERAATAADPACAGTVERARALAPLVKGDVAGLALATEPRRLPPLAFTDAAGKPVSLSDLKGRVLLVNLWATWCVPCRKEMPALDALEGAAGGPDFQVVAINLDTRDPEKPRTFLSDIGVKHLAYFADPATRTFQSLRTVGRGFGLPTTLLVDRDGCEMAYLAGPAEWGGDDARALIQAAVGTRRADAAPPAR